jgi:hypothetical protein
MNLASIWLKLNNFIELGIRVLEHKLGNAKLPKIREIKGNYVRTMLDRFLCSACFNSQVHECAM